MFYFAYGSNMNHQQMGQRCPGAIFLRRAYLDGFRYVYDGYSEKRNCAVANVVADKKNRVWGGLFEISENNLSALDRYEGCPSIYQRSELDVKDDGGKLYKAIVYLRAAGSINKPSEEYRNIILQGAQDCGLPKDYIKSFL